MLRRLRAPLRKLRRDNRGQELVELAMILPIVLLILLGTMELGHTYYVTHAMTGLSREAANLAARGSSLAQSAQIAVQNGADIDLVNKGGALSSRLVVTGGVPIVVEQASYGSVGSSKMGIVGSPALALPALVLDEGRVLYTVEIYYQYSPITPLVGLMGGLIPSGLYERALF